eukprot:305010-Pelagomonas_calceolata.AAC.1
MMQTLRITRSTQLNRRMDQRCNRPRQAHANAGLAKELDGQLNSPPAARHCARCRGSGFTATPASTVAPSIATAATAAAAAAPAPSSCTIAIAVILIAAAVPDVGVVTVVVGSRGCLVAAVGLIPRRRHRGKRARVHAAW